MLGADVAIDISAMDETNTRVRIEDIVAQFKKHDGFGLVGLVGVQSNQFPRALDIARPLREAGIAVSIGGFHVSGCIAMLDEMQADLKVALDMGCSLFAGEAEEGRFDVVLRDAADGRLKPIYNYMAELPGLEATPTPFLPPRNLKRTANHYASFDAGRGCPYQCSFCTIINVQGRKSRRRTPDDIEQLLRRHIQYGFHWFFVTDDNFARNKDWEPIFDRIIELRERDGLNIKMIIQVDTLCHKIPNFIEKAARAGVKKVFIGLENINPANLMAAKKRQNKITEYRTMLLAWKQAKVITYAGYILGFPADTPESIREDIEIIKKELPLDILEFFCLTPLPGSEDHKVLTDKGVWMDPDMNKYDLEQVVTAHARMSGEQWNGIYRAAWDIYYTPEHMRTIMRRAAAFDLGLSHLQGLLFMFSKAVAIENLHPLQGGIWRRKVRRDRRHGLPIEPAWRFYPKAAFEVVAQGVVHGALLDAARPHAPRRAEGPQPACLYGCRADAGRRRRDRDAGDVHAQRRREERSDADAQDSRADARRGARSGGGVSAVASTASLLFSCHHRAARSASPGDPLRDAQCPLKRHGRDKPGHDSIWCCK